MKLENIKTENDARQLLVENIVNIKSTLSGTNLGRFMEALEVYDQNLPRIKKEHSFDTTPYNNVVNSLLNANKYFEELRI